MTDVHAEIERLASGLERAVSEAGETLSESTVTRVRDLEAKREARMGLGEEYSVIAFAGSTGSGKSSLFNAVSGLEISRVGVRRPTTSKPTACVWGDGGEEVLAWLGVPVEHRTWRESALDGNDESALHGLILVDLPDHDSTAPEHRLESDRLVGLVDIVLWVVDPQKYADYSLHSHYLSAFAEHSAQTVFVLNQVDRLSQAEREACVDHLRQLLREDGFSDARIVEASAVERTGVPELREILTESVAARAAASNRLLADLRSAAADVRAELGEDAVDPDRLSGADALVSAMADAAGIDALTQLVHDDYMRRSYKQTGYPVLAMAQRGKADPLGSKHGSDREELLREARPTTTKSQSARVSLAAHNVVAEAASGLPRSWRQLVLAEEQTSAARLSRTLDEAVTAVDIEPRTPGWWTTAKVLQILFFALTVIGVLGFLVPVLMTVLGTGAGLWHWLIPAVLVLIGAVGSLVTSSWAAGARRRGAKQAADDADAALRDAVRSAAESSYLDPIVAVLTRHRDLLAGLR